MVRRNPPVQPILWAKRCGRGGALLSVFLNNQRSTALPVSRATRMATASVSLHWSNLGG